MQVARAGGGVNFKGLYSGISGNIAGVLPYVTKYSRKLTMSQDQCFLLFPLNSASAIFIGVYEPVKQALLKVVPEHLSAGAHLVRENIEM